MSTANEKGTTEQPRPSRTRVRRIEGLIIESAIIRRYDDTVDAGPSLELEFVGGMTFCFTSQALIIRSAVTTLGLKDSDDFQSREFRAPVIGELPELG